MEKASKSDKAARIGAAFGVLAIISLLALTSQAFGYWNMNSVVTKVIEVGVFGVAVGVVGCLVSASFLEKWL